MKVTIYELIGLVKDCKAPKKIKFRNEIYEYKNNIEDGLIDYVGIEKETNERFYFTDYFLNLPKRKYFDPFICSEII